MNENKVINREFIEFLYLKMFETIKELNELRNNNIEGEKLFRTIERINMLHEVIDKYFECQGINLI